MKTTKRLSDKVAEYVRELILTNKMKNGEPVDEVALAEKLKLSRTPVREALSSLEKEGLVKVIPGKGAFITELTFSDYREINELRSFLEPMAAVMSMANVTDEEVDKQLSIWTKIRADLLSGECIPSTEMIKYDHQLHSLLIDRCRNNRLISILWILRQQSMRYLFTVWSTDSYNEKTAEEHLSILEAMKSKDTDKLSELLSAHVVISSKYISDGLI
jgi:DNA-binding GntR family transcriptional regulator